jgi:hypothetical protein
MGAGVETEALALSLGSTPRAGKSAARWMGLQDLLALLDPFRRLSMRVRPFGLASCTRLLTGFHGKTCREGVERGIGLDLGRIEGEFLAPDEPSLLALLDHRLEEAPQHLQAVAGTDTRQTRMVGHRLIEMVAEVPAHTESVRRHAEERAFGADPFSERIPSKNMTNWRLKKTTGSTLGRPMPAA